MMKQFAISIPLKVWQDPQGDVVLSYSREGCSVSFGCWDTAGEPADYICKLIFNHAWAARAFDTEYLPYDYEPHRSCIFKVEDSQWLKHESERRSKSYPRWKEWDSELYEHFVVRGHDSYVEVIAAGFEEQLLSRSEAGELARLIDEA